MSRDIVVKRNNNCEKRGRERVFFLSPQFSMQSEISWKNVSVPWGVVKLCNFYQTSYSEEI